jgi:hypothetical protein
MRNTLAAALLLALATSAHAGVMVSTPYWVVALSCDNNPSCYARSNGSYTGNQENAKRFYDEAEAGKFLGTLTSSLRDKSPRLEQHIERRCVEGSSLSGQPC